MIFAVYRAGRCRRQNLVLEQHLGAALSRIFTDRCCLNQDLVRWYSRLGQGGGDRLRPVERGFEAVQLLVCAVAEPGIADNAHLAWVASVEGHDLAEILPVGIAEGCRIGGEVDLRNRRIDGRRQLLNALAGSRGGGAGRDGSRQNRRGWRRL